MIPLDEVTLDTSSSATESMYEHVHVLSWVSTHVTLCPGHPKEPTCGWVERGRRSLCVSLMGIKCLPVQYKDMKSGLVFTVEEFFCKSIVRGELKKCI